MFKKTGKLPEHLSEEVRKEFEKIESYIIMFERNLKVRKPNTDVEIEYATMPYIMAPKLWIFRMNIYVNNMLILKKEVPYLIDDNAKLYGFAQDITLTMFLYGLDNMLKIIEKRHNENNIKRTAFPPNNKRFRTEEKKNRNPTR